MSTFFLKDEQCFSEFGNYIFHFNIVFKIFCIYSTVQQAAGSAASAASTAVASSANIKVAPASELQKCPEGRITAMWQMPNYDAKFGK